MSDVKRVDVLLFLRPLHTYILHSTSFTSKCKKKSCYNKNEDTLYISHSHLHKYIKHTPACPPLKRCCLAPPSSDLPWPYSLRSRPPSHPDTHVIQSPCPYREDPSPNGALIRVYQPWDEAHTCVPQCYTWQTLGNDGKPQDRDGRCIVIVKGMLMAERFWVRGRTKWHWKAYVKTAGFGLWAFFSV